MYGTHCFILIHPYAKYAKTIIKQKKVPGQNTNLLRQTDEQTEWFIIPHVKITKYQEVFGRGKIGRKVWREDGDASNHFFLNCIIILFVFHFNEHYKLIMCIKLLCRKIQLIIYNYINIIFFYLDQPTTTTKIWSILSNLLPISQNI